MSRPSLDQRIIIVTGGGQGIGRALSFHLASEGAQVIVADLNHENAVAVAEEIGPGAVGLKLDVSDSVSCALLAETVTQQFARVDGIVNNAAVFSTIKMKPFWQIDVTEWDSLMGVNVRGPWLVVSALLPLLRASQFGSIVNFGSDSVGEGRGGYLHYIASKAAVQGMTFAMSHELGEFGIRVNTISPGATKTEIPRSTVTPEQLENMLAARALHRVATPADLCGVVTFLLSDESAFITGQTLSVNGGSLHR